MHFFTPDTLCFQPTEDVIADYELQYARREREMQAFLQLRMALAPCIEALLLLDRLCYLHEQVTYISTVVEKWVTSYIIKLNSV